MEKRNQAAKLIIGAVVVIIAVLALAGIVAGRDIVYKASPLSREDVTYGEAEAPAATSADGTISANDWAAVYPHIVESLHMTSEYTDAQEDYLEVDPYLKELYAQYGFAKDYKSARGHEYTMLDVIETLRTGENSFASCLTCKTPNFTKYVEENGVAAYKENFLKVHAKLMANGGENVSCYTCHGNTPNVWHAVDPEKADSKTTNLTVTHTYVSKALGDNAKAIDPGVLACGQCHIEYYFDPTTGETSMPYHSVEEMTPEAIYAYYQSIGFSDWTQTDSTGAKLLKVQHPEMETYLYGKHAGTLSCADCHMPVVQDANDLTIYHSHSLVSPLDNEALLASCAECHGDTDMVAFVHNIQDRVTAEEKRVGNKLAAFRQVLTDAVQAGMLSDAVLDDLREVYREAQWFFDFCYVENSEGAHNSDLSMHCLEVAEALVNAGTEELNAANDLITLGQAIDQANGKVDVSVIAEARGMLEEAQKFFDLCYAGASDTPRHAALSSQYLKNAQSLIKQATQKLAAK